MQRSPKSAANIPAPRRQFAKAPNGSTSAAVVEPAGSAVAGVALTDEEARTLFAGIEAADAVALAVSGGPDSTALLVLAARWCANLGRGPKLFAFTVDHGLRPEARSEARRVAALARELGVPHRTLRWRGPKPVTGIQESARAARYRLLAEAALGAGAKYLLAAHTLDDQAETVLFRLARGSGLSGLAGMRRETVFSPDGLPLNEDADLASAHAELPQLVLVRPLLEICKARLVATLAVSGVPFSQDPSNTDARFARPRWRALMPHLAHEGLDARRLAQLARRMARADRAIEHAVDAADGLLRRDGRALRLAVNDFAALPEEVALRLLGRAITEVGNELPVELGKLEALCAALNVALAGGGAGFRRTLAGAVVASIGGDISLTTAPARRKAAARAFSRVRDSQS